MFEQCCGCKFHVSEFNFGVQRAIGEHPLINLNAQIAWYYRFKHSPKAPSLGPVTTAHFDDISKPFGRDDSGLGTLAFQKRIGADGRAMDNE